MYWNNSNSNTLTVSDIGNYINFPHMISTIPEGYNCDTLQNTSVLFVGSCDLDGPINDTMQSWARLLHSDMKLKYGNLPYIALAKMTAGFISVPRRLLTFCEKYGAPEQLFMVVPRPVAIEIPILSGELVSVSNRASFPNYLLKHERINSDDHALLISASNFCQSQMKNDNYQIYQFEQTASFINLICKHYNIKLKWTLNLSASAIAYYNKFFIPFMENCPYMMESFAGAALAKDFSFDGSMGNESQYEIYKVFAGNSRNTSDVLAILHRNLTTAQEKTSVIQQSMP